VQIFTHQQVRDDQIVLFGFGSLAERDLFRQLISVSGVGPQIAMALLDGMSLPDVIQAIVSGNTRLLSRTPGIGAKTAERIALELKNKLVEWRQQSGIMTTPDASPAGTIQEEVEITLIALGYSNSEIIQALRAVGQKTALSKTDNAEEWIREAIAWLSR
jgi:Holliday junction DNA helicase RuvA